VSNLSKKIAKRYLWTKRSEAFITIITYSAIIGVALGVMVLTMTMSIMTGFEYELKNKIVGSAHILVTGIAGGVRNADQVADFLKEQKELVSVSEFSQHQVLLQIGNYSRGLLLKGIQSGTAAGAEVQSYLKSGSLDEALNPKSSEVEQANLKANLPGIIFGHQLIQQLGLKKGDIVNLISSQMQSGPFGFMPRFRRFQITGVYESGLSGYEETLAYINIDSAKTFFRLANSVTGFELKIKNSAEAPSIASKLSEQLVDRFGAGFYAQDWTQSNRELWEAIQLEKRVYFLVLLLLIVLASFSIVSSLVMIVMEKRKDIAILKTMGARNQTIAMIFRWQGAVIGTIGVSSGLIAGVLGCIALDVYGFPLPEKVFPVSTVPVKIEWINFLVVGVSAFFICLLSTWYPAKRASSIEPSEVLRG
jgi:lipoprotein-releasing system permease protein